MLGFNIGVSLRFCDFKKLIAAVGGAVRIDGGREYFRRVSGSPEASGHKIQEVQKFQYENIPEMPVTKSGDADAASDFADAALSGLDGLYGSLYGDTDGAGEQTAEITQTAVPDAVTAVTAQTSGAPVLTSVTDRNEDISGLALPLQAEAVARWLAVSKTRDPEAAYAKFSRKTIVKLLSEGLLINTRKGLIPGT